LVAELGKNVEIKPDRSLPKSFCGVPACKSGIADQPMADSMSFEMVQAMIAAMRARCAGGIDGDYAEPVVGAPSTLGALENPRVHFASATETCAGILSTPALLQVTKDANSWSL
jgi:hypothetical protein